MTFSDLGPVKHFCSSVVTVQLMKWKDAPVAQSELVIKEHFNSIFLEFPISCVDQTAMMSCIRQILQTKLMGLFLCFGRLIGATMGLEVVR